MLIGERPGVTEHEEGKAFVGVAGQELWARIWRILRLTREDFYVSNLVKTFSVEPPTPEEIARDAHILRRELIEVRPRVILTIGYHAARALLPQFYGVTGDRFHGLSFPFTYGALKPRTATVVPIVHASAALRQPDRYQNQLTKDLQAVKRVLEGTQAHHVAKAPFVYQIGLAAFGKEGQTLGVDTEGSKLAPECVTMALSARDVACIETFDKAPSKFMGAGLRHARALCMHYALHDVPVLEALGVPADSLPTIIDTMIECYLLDLPQSLKTVAYRELGYEMRDYADLVEPLDETLVRQTLSAKLAEWDETIAGIELRAAVIEQAIATHAKKRLTKKAIAARVKRMHARSSVPPNRVVSGLRRMLTIKEEMPNGDAEE